MKRVRLGLLGAAGGIAGMHKSYFDKIDGLELAAVCDVSDERVAPVAEATGARAWTDGEAMIRSGEIDAVLIACPHFDHPRYARIAFDAGVHALTEKPVAVTAAEAEETDRLYAEAQKEHPGLLYAGMFNQRTHPVWKEIKRLVAGGELGELMRVGWTISTWFRTQSYYDSGGWRATWSGEGGGVLLNQCPHNLDLLCWFVGQPSRVIAKASLGKQHAIEVEDEVSALLDFPNGATGTFFTSTGEAPGVNRLEIVGTGGTVICEDNKLTFLRAGTPVDEFTRTCSAKFATLPTTRMEVTPPPLEGPEHEHITRNFVETILAGGGQGDLIAPAPEGILGLELGNAMLMSGLQGSFPIDLPMDRAAFAAKLKELQAASTYVKPEVKEAEGDLAKSFA
ncbi:Gfo/Idh/MocA family protein [Phycisphaera mikurensis]|uniref:Putative oxidoreductase n=1 Tax=Phycisphaera mikurensis (strain NBRC 102666 / KCTC 22515 / FYK2301M01) TaxID=1142394 RepID=I0IG52_PHYMF|nr:Gfo/Idh/MocA family oxidoreductase [Phycisphaera mikurensis]MBB6440377.1 putative dehydrogenase [Phycisphaera mikurensis]BAM04240.1 putative oxidoreductase [Phycisphaera mikurensis NBRC 102666]